MYEFTAIDYDPDSGTLFTVDNAHNSAKVLDRTDMRTWKNDQVYVKGPEQVHGIRIDKANRVLYLIDTSARSSEPTLYFSSLQSLQPTSSLGKVTLPLDSQYPQIIDLAFSKNGLFSISGRFLNTTEKNDKIQQFSSEYKLVKAINTGWITTQGEIKRSLDLTSKGDAVVLNQVPDGVASQSEVKSSTVNKSQLELWSLSSGSRTRVANTPIFSSAVVRVDSKDRAYMITRGIVYRYDIYSDKLEQATIGSSLQSAPCSPDWSTYTIKEGVGGVSLIYGYYRGGRTATSSTGPVTFCEAWIPDQLPPLECPAGYYVKDNACVVQTKPVSNPTALPNGWYDVTKDSSGNYVRCDVTRLKSCAYQLNLNGPVFSGYDGVRKTWAEADAQCKLLGYRLPTDKELINARFLLASVQELNGPSWPSDEFFWSGTLSADNVYATRVWLPGDDPRQDKISDSWNRNQVLCVASTSPKTLTDSPSSPGGSTSSSIVSSTVSVAGFTYTLSGPSIAKVDQCVALTLKRNSPTNAALALFPGLKSGQGGVFTDSSCSRPSWSGISIPKGSSAVTFYFQNWSTGSTTIDLTSLTTGDSFGEHVISVQK
jgi:hypothetical protein